MGTALDAFEVDCGRYPTTEEGLHALVEAPGNVQDWRGPYLKKGVPADPWGNPYTYKAPGNEDREFELVSYGQDAAPGGTGESADINSYN